MEEEFECSVHSDCKFRGVQIQAIFGCGRVVNKVGFVNSVLSFLAKKSFFEDARSADSTLPLTLVNFEITDRQKNFCGETATLPLPGERPMT